MSTTSQPLEHVFPGHPVTLAVDIMRRYPSYQAACARDAMTTEPMAALRNAAIPGAADHIRAALELLRFSLDGHAELAIEAAEEYWRISGHSCGGGTLERGSELAATHADELRQRLASWPEASR